MSKRSFHVKRLQWIKESVEYTGEEGRSSIVLPCGTEVDATATPIILRVWKETDIDAQFRQA